MENNNNLTRVDELIKHFWKNGYLTVKRKYGNYLPAPEQIGTYEIEAIGKKINNYAIGITLTNDDIKESNLIKKLEFLASRHTKYTHKNVLLFVAVPQNLFSKVKKLIVSIDPAIRKNIRLVSIQDKKHIN